MLMMMNTSKLVVLALVALVTQPVDVLARTDVDSTPLAISENVCIHMLLILSRLLAIRLKSLERR